MCNEYHILNKLEKDIFETLTETNSSLIIKKLCTYDINKELVPKIEKQYNESIKIMSNKIGKTESWVKQEVVENVENIYNQNIQKLKEYGNDILNKDYNKSINQVGNFFEDLLK